MCRADKSFDPFAESTVDGIIAGAVTVRVRSNRKALRQFRSSQAKC